MSTVIPKATPRTQIKKSLGLARIHKFRSKEKKLIAQNDEEAIQRQQRKKYLSSVSDALRRPSQFTRLLTGYPICWEKVLSTLSSNITMSSKNKETPGQSEAYHLISWNDFNYIERGLAANLILFEMDELKPRVPVSLRVSESHPFSQQNIAYEKWVKLYSSAQYPSNDDIIARAESLKARGFDSVEHRARLVKAIQGGIVVPIFNEVTFEFEEGAQL